MRVPRRGGLIALVALLASVVACQTLLDLTPRDSGDQSRSDSGGPTDGGLPSGNAEAGLPDAAVDASEGPSQTLYTYFGDKDVWTDATTRKFWGGRTNAPPATGVVSATLVTKPFERLVVITADGMVYRRAEHDIWMEPKKLNDVFAQIPGVPSTTVNVRSQAQGDAEVVIVMVFGRVGYPFKYGPTDVVTPLAPQLQNDETSEGGPNKATDTPLWDFEVYNDAAVPDASFVDFFVAYDQTVFKLDAAQRWSSCLLSDFPYFKGKPKAPSVPIGAAYFDSEQNRLYMISRDAQ